MVIELREPGRGPNRRSGGRGGGLLCPVCRVDLAMSEKQGVEIDYCPDCRGVWLDRGELEKLIARGMAEEQAWESRSRRPEPPAEPRRERDYDGRDHRSDDYDRGKHGGRGKHGKRGRKSWLETVFDVLD